MDLERHEAAKRKNKIIKFDFTLTSDVPVAITEGEIGPDEEMTIQVKEEPEDEVICTEESGAVVDVSEKKEERASSSTDDAFMRPSEAAQPKRTMKGDSNLAPTAKAKIASGKGGASLPPPPPPKAKPMPKPAVHPPSPRGSVGHQIRHEAQSRALSANEDDPSFTYEIYELGLNEPAIMKSVDLPGVLPLDPRVTPEAQWLGRKLCGLLRGFDHERRSYRIPPPEMDADLWLPFKEVFTYIKRRYIKDLTMPTMVKTLKGNHRFMVQILTTGRSSDGSRERGMGNLAYTIVNVKCIQGHCRTVTDHPERSV